MFILFLILFLFFIYFLVKYFKLKKLNKNNKIEIYCCMPEKVKLKDDTNVMVRINFEYIITGKTVLEEAFKTFETLEVLGFQCFLKCIKDIYDIKELENKKEDIKNYVYNELSKFDGMMRWDNFRIVNIELKFGDEVI